MTAVPRPFVALVALVLLMLLGGAAGCGGGAAGSPVGQLRFHNRPPVWVVDDRRHVPVEPAENKFFRALYHFDGAAHARLDRWMQMRRVVRAENVNSLDEVPDSTWFTNRIGVRDMTAEEIAVGPNRTGSPKGHGPWVIKSSKALGVTVGFLIEDRRGVRYILKFDEVGIPEAETAADVVLQRLLWAAGYYVPEDYVVYFRRSDLVMSKSAVIKDPMGNEAPMTEAFIDNQLAKVDIRPDGTIRGLASQFLPGKPMGGHIADGVRPDDPNDTIRHENRRELRGLYPILAWLDQVDVKEDNSLDVYVEDPAQKGVRYVVHYLLDFGRGLGEMALSNKRRFVGSAYLVDFRDMAGSLLSLGLWQRPWEDRAEPDLVGVGLFGAEHFDPGSWKPYMPPYYPFHVMDRFDGFWGAKIVARFSREHIRAAVDQGRFSDPRAADYVTEVLIQRQRKTARYWFKKVNPLDRFTVEAVGQESGTTAQAFELCFDDLTLVYKLEDRNRATTRYSARVYDRDGRATGPVAHTTADGTGRACLARFTASSSPEGYTMVHIATRRPGLDVPGTVVHLARDPRSGLLRIIGLRRL